MASLSYTTSKSRTIQTRRELGRGGEGVVYEVDGGYGQVAKIYHPTHRTDERAQKLLAMISSPPQDDTQRLSPPHVSIAWPVDVLYEGGAFAGFLMPRIDASPTVFQIYNPQLREQKFSSLDGRHLHHIAKNLATALNALHARGYVMGDVNQKNILVKSNALVTLVDTDSFQVHDSTQGRTYRCSVGVPEYTPPELQGLNLGSLDREPHHDCFGLAIIIFQLLMEGFHPFTGTPKNPSCSLPGEVYLHCIKQGIFPYRVNKEVAPPPNAPDFSALHPEIQDIFVRCFVSGHRSPSDRPTARQWIDTLDRAQKGLVQCKRNKSHWYANHASKCHWCDREARRPLPVQQPLGPSPLNAAPWMPQKVLPPPFVPATWGGRPPAYGSSLLRRYAKWLVVVYFAFFVLGLIAHPVVLGFMTALGALAVALVKARQGTWGYSFAGAGCIVALLLGASLAGHGTSVVSRN